MSSCYKTSNNKYLNCPPRMDDARHFTDYRPNCQVNNLVRANNGSLNSFQYRMYLTHNANELMELNRTYACQKNCCGPCMNPYNEGTMLSEKTKVSCDDRTCNTTGVNPKGLGQGRNYNTEESQQQCANWPESFPVNQPYNCCADNNSLFNYYNHADTKAQGEFIPRLTVPGGGKAMHGGDPQAYNM